MSLLKTNAVQIGQSSTATQNFVLTVPSPQDGTIKLSRGNAGSTSADIFSVSPSGVVTFTNNIVEPTLPPTVNVCSVYRSGAQNINNAVFNRVMLNTVAFDTGSFFDTIANYRFTPTVAGYYNIYAQVAFGSSGAGQRVVSLYKNGSGVRTLQGGPAITGANTVIGGSMLLPFNGTSDYAELWAFQDSTATQTIFGATFDAFFVRA